MSIDARLETDNYAETKKWGLTAPFITMQLARVTRCDFDGEINVEPTQECFDAVYDALSGNDPTGDAVFFYNPDIATCSWMQSVEKHNVISIGQHLFFTL